MVAAARIELAPPKRLVSYDKRFKAITLYFVTNQKRRTTESFRKIYTAEDTDIHLRLTRENNISRAHRLTELHPRKVTQLNRKTYSVCVLRS